MIPVLLFITIIGGFTSLHILYPVYFATIFLLMAIYRSFDAFDHPKPYSAAFDTGFLLGIGSLFYFNFIIIFPAFLFGISILSRNYGWRQFVLLTMGFILPIVFASAYAIYTEQLAELSKGLFRSVTIKNKPESINLPQIVFLGYLIILTVLSSIKIIQQFDTKKVSTRIYFIIFFLLFILSVSGYILIPSASHEMLIITAIPLTFLISNFFVFLNSRLWGEILFSILLIIVISLQFLT
jgi:hypothetical protein